MLDAEDRSAERARRPAAGADLAVTDDQTSQLGEVDLARGAGMHDPAGAHHHQVVGDLENFEQLVADQHDRPPRGGDPPDDRHQPGGLKR